MRKSDLKRLVGSQTDLPTLPSVAVQVLNAVRDDGEDFETLAEIISSDQSLASRVLSYANTATYRKNGPVADIERAIKLLGTRTIRNVVVGVSVFRLFDTHNQIKGFNLPDFWRHCIGVSLAARSFARILGYPDPEEAFAAGLLHDLGKLFFVNRMPEEFAQAIEEHVSSGASLTEVEEDTIGISHTQAGKWLAENWGLPRSLTDAIWLHHQPLGGSEYAISHSLPAIVRLADSLCLLYRIGASGNYRMVSPGEITSACSGVDENRLQGMVADIVKHLDEVSALLGLENHDEDLFLNAVQMSNQELGRTNILLAQQQKTLERERGLLKSVCHMNAEIDPTATLGEVIEHIANHALDAFDVDRVLCFVIDREEGFVDGRIARRSPSTVEHISLPLSNIAEREATGSLRAEELDLIERSLLAMPEGPEVWNEVVNTLQRGSLAAWPLVSAGAVVGQLLVDFGPQSQSDRPSRSEFEVFVSSAAQCIQRCRLHTEATESAEELARMARRAEENQVQLYRVQRLASVGKLAAGCAHEINNPLAVISGTAQMLLRQLQADEGKSKQLTTIIAQAKRITKIINDLMGLARPAEPRIEYTDIPAVIDETISLIEERRGFDRIRFVREYETELPKTLADPKQLEQVFVNLFINARDAMPEGGDLTIRVNTLPDRRLVTISVSDTGEGIPTETMEHIFDPFFTTKKEGEGTGLGLAISHSIIEAHRGTMQVQSVPGQGTTFRISMPVRQRTTISDFRKELVKARKKQPKMSVVDTEKRVLLVDDEEQIRAILADALVGEGFSVSQASDGVEGMRYLGESRFDIVLLDLRMPHKDGLEMLGEIRKSFPKMPVIVVTGLASEKEIKEAANSGAYAVMKKPFDIDELIFTVKKAIKEDGETVQGNGA